MRSLLIAILLCSSALGQDVIVGPTNIQVGPNNVPRFSTLYPEANNLIVPAGQTQTLPANFDYSAIEVAGVLKLSRDYDTTGKLTVIQVLPGGSLDFGSASDPVLRKVDLQIKDSPLLTGTDGALGPDPEQFGSGILVFGEWKCFGKQKTAWTTMQPTTAGATQVIVADASGWNVGDSLLVPDTRKTAYYNPQEINLPNIPQRRESPVTITAISGNVLTLSKPLDFEHEAQAGLLPYVANCTRNITIRSENPLGVRGHAMFMGTAHVNLYYTSFIGLGRTLPITLDSFNSNTQHVGTNQIARYAVHWHHVHGHADAQGLTGRLVGCYLDGTDVNKWGQVQHGTHDLLIADNVAERFVGACFTPAEDGYEVRGQYLRNLAAYAKGNGDDGKNNVLNKAPGSEGAGFWGHGSGSTFADNVSLCCRIGQSFVHIDPVMGRSIPSIPGGENDTPFDPTESKPLSHKRNISFACGTGLEEWRFPDGWTAEDFTVVNASRAVFMGAGEGGSFKAVNPRFINPVQRPYQTTWGVHCSEAYSGHMTLVGGVIEGFTYGSGDARRYDITGTRFKSTDTDLTWTGVGGHMLYPFAITDAVLEGPIPLIIGDGGNQPPDSERNWDNLFRITNWQGDGKAYAAYEKFKAPAGAISLPGLVNAKAVEIGVAPPPTPTVSAITANPADVDPATPGVQEYPGPVTYSATANGPITWYYSVSGGQRTQYGTGNSITFTYSGPVNYTWYAVNGTAESSLAVQVVNPPATPPATASVRVTLPDGSVYEGTIPKK